jgi:DNA-directed RNA polymerase subunit RPC12/RpoP
MSIFRNIFNGSSSSSDDITWYCDGCNTVLNEQEGFNTDSGTWTCTECGFVNDVTSDNVYESEEDYQESMGIPKCPYCGGMLKGDAPDATRFFNCDFCNTRFYLENGELIDLFDKKARRHTSRLCSNCGQSLSGGEYTAPWENGNNSDGYIKCPHCGYINYDWDD